MRSLGILGRVIVALVLGLVALAPIGCDCCTRRGANGLWSLQSTEKAGSGTANSAGRAAQVEKSKAS